MYIWRIISYLTFKNIIMKLLRNTGIFIAFSVGTVCNAQVEKTVEVNKKENTAFEYVVEQFSDIKVLRYQIPGWENLTLKEQKLVYYLTQAGTSGRDIMWDQNYRYNLKIRKALENIYQKYKGDKSSEDWSNFEIYLKECGFRTGFIITIQTRKFNLISPHHILRF